MTRLSGANYKELGARLKFIATMLLILLPLQAGAQTNSGDRQTTPSTKQADADRPEDLSKRPGFLFAIEGGGGWLSSPAPSPSAYGGVKIGLPPFILDMGYDWAQSRHGFSTEVSGLLPLFRTPGPQKDEKKNYLRVYAEPGLGYRAGGAIGGYGSAKVLMVLFSDHRLTSSSAPWSPFIEVQRRFPFGSPLRGDTRIAIGIMTAICEHCGLD
jgi:hypothetical protein